MSWIEKIGAAFIEHADWRKDEKALRELRREVTFALLAVEDDESRVAALVEELFNILTKNRHQE